MPGTPGVQKSATLAPSGPFQLKCSDPFPRAQMDPKQSTYDGSARALTADATVVVPATGVNLKEWRVTVYNTANIAGVAVVTDNTLDQPDLPVYQIVAPAGSTIAWTATDGTTTVSGTSTGTADAPAGFRFATSTVTSPSLAPPNTIPEQNFRTAFTVRYLYKVSPGAPGGARRMNTASAVMQWPGHPEFPDTVFGPTTGTVVLIAPFGRIDAWKGGYMTANVPGGVIGGNNNDHPTNVIDMPIPTSSTSFWWNAWLVNSGNAPAIATITDSTLNDPELPITQLQPLTWSSAGGCCGHIPANIQYTLDDGTMGTALNVTVYNAPAGRRVVSFTATTVNPITGGSTTPADGGWNSFVMNLGGTIGPNATPNSLHTNTFTGSLDYQNPSVPNLTDGNTFSAHLVGPNPTITRRWAPRRRGWRDTGDDDVGCDVHPGWFDLAGSAHENITPEYVFMARPGGTLPRLRRRSRRARPPACSLPTGRSRSPGCASGGGHVVAAGDGIPQEHGVADHVGDRSPRGVRARGLRGGAAVHHEHECRAVGRCLHASVQRRSRHRQLSRDDAVLRGGCSRGRAGGCGGGDAGVEGDLPAGRVTVGWMPVVLGPEQLGGCSAELDEHPVPDLVANAGNTALSDVVGYDILPYVGDTGTSDATGSTARGSTFRESVASVTGPTNGATVTFSTPTQPCRPEVDATVPGCTNDWSGASTGAQAIRVARPGTLAAGDSFSMQYTAAVNNAPGFGARASNSFAVKATGLTNVSEPAPVTATIEETDLQVVAGTPHLQQGRPGLLPWTVTNLGGAPSTQGQVTVTIPAGLTATSFTPTGWVCTAVDGGGTPVFGTAIGPATLSCTPNSPLLLNVPQALNVPVQATTTSAMTSRSTVSGRLFDGNQSNNQAQMSVNPTPAAGNIGVTKTDGVTTATPGQVLTYTVTVTNPLDFETLHGATLTDALPPRVVFVSASNGGTESRRTVAWALPDVLADGTLTRTVTVRVSPAVNLATLVNTATVSSPDPGEPGRHPDRVQHGYRHGGQPSRGDDREGIPTPDVRGGG